MTREEANIMAESISYRQAVYNALAGRCVPYRKATKKKLLELLDMLEAEPCEDAVSREAVLDYIRDNYRRWFINDDAFMQCVNGIKDFISVTPVRAKGNFTRQELEDWLYSICLNNFDTDFGKHVEEIINRLDGFEKYIEDMREGEVDADSD